MSEERSGDQIRVAGRDSSERYLSFSLCDEQYAIPLLEVKEVIALTEATPIPKAPAYFKGIINLRGQVISVIDLRVKLGLGKPTVATETSIIILDIAQLSLGVVVDSVNSVLALEGRDISPAPDIDRSGQGKFIRGVARRENNLSLLLDIHAVLDVADLRLLNQRPAADAA